jgi:phosphoesterase RecJ-like protein
MIHELVRGAGWTPDLPAATALYVGLATDTGFFRFNSTDADAYQAAADLVREGVEPFRIYRAIYERNSEAYTRLLGHALVGLTVEPRQLAYVAITRKTLADLDAEQVDSSEITTALLAMDGITVALLFRELDGGQVKVSLRSKGVLDVHKLAAEFGGGGHRNASGIVMAGTLDQAVQVVTQRTTALLAD